MLSELHSLGRGRVYCGIEDEREFFADLDRRREEKRSPVRQVEEHEYPTTSRSAGLLSSYAPERVGLKMQTYNSGQRWASFDSNLQSVEDFLAAWVPTRTFSPQYEWIVASLAKPSKSKVVVVGDVAGLMAEWDQLCLRPDIDFVDGTNLAVRHNVLRGKWLLFVSGGVVDEYWRRITRTLFSGQLGQDIKVSTTNVWDVKLAIPKEECGKDVDQKPQKGNHVICVYANDFQDIKDVLRIREALKVIGFAGKLKFKLEAFLFCQIYHGNRWKINPSMFTE